MNGYERARRRHQEQDGADRVNTIAAEAVHRAALAQQTRAEILGELRSTRLREAAKARSEWLNTESGRFYQAWKDRRSEITIQIARMQIALEAVAAADRIEVEVLVRRRRRFGRRRVRTTDDSRQRAFYDPAHWAVGWPVTRLRWSQEEMRMGEARPCLTTPLAMEFPRVRDILDSDSPDVRQLIETYRLLDWSHPGIEPR